MRSAVDQKGIAQRLLASVSRIVLALAVVAILLVVWIAVHFRRKFDPIFEHLSLDASDTANDLVWLSPLALIFGGAAIIVLLILKEPLVSAKWATLGVNLAAIVCAYIFVYQYFLSLFEVQKMVMGR